MKIATKVSLIIGTLVLVLFSVNSLIALKLQSSFSQTIIATFTETQQEELMSFKKTSEENLLGNLRRILSLCADSAQPYLYDVQSEELRPVLASFADMQGVMAIAVTDEADAAFAAAWLDGTGTAVDPEFLNELNLEQVLTNEVVREGEKLGSIKLYYSDEIVQTSVAKRQEKTAENIDNFNSITDESIANAIKAQVIAAAAIIVVLVLAMTVSLNLIVTRSLNATVSMLKDISEGEGDLTKRLQVASKDEIGELSRYFNLFIDKLQRIIIDISNNIVTLASTSSKQSETAAEMTSTVEEMDHQSTSAASAVEELSTGLSNVTQGAEKVSASVTTVATAIKEMNTSIAEIAKNCSESARMSSEADAKTRKAGATMNDLNDSATGIGKVVETINDIANQTKLLALNATIEAASAGEAGKGFAVVANEVKELSSQTARATEEIQRIIDEIQDKSGDAVAVSTEISAVIEQLNGTVQSISSAVEEQSITANDISENISAASKGAVGISENIQEASTSSNEASKNIAALDTVSSSVKSGANETNVGSSELADMAENLQRLVGQFKTR